MATKETTLKSILIGGTLGIVIGLFGQDLTGEALITYWSVILMGMVACSIILISYRLQLKYDRQKLLEEIELMNECGEWLLREVYREQKTLEQQFNAKGVHLSKSEIENELLK